MRTMYALFVLLIVGSIGSEATAQTNVFAAKPAASANKMSIAIYGTATPPAGFTLFDVKLILWEPNGTLSIASIPINAVTGEWPVTMGVQDKPGNFKTAKASFTYDILVLATFTSVGQNPQYAGTKATTVISSK